MGPGSEFLCIIRHQTHNIIKIFIISPLTPMSDLYVNSQCQERPSVNIENSETAPKNRIFFYFFKKSLLMNYFRKKYAKGPARFIF